MGWKHQLSGLLTIRLSPNQALLNTFWWLVSEGSNNANVIRCMVVLRYFPSIVHCLGWFHAMTSNQGLHAAGWTDSQISIRQTGWGLFFQKIFNGLTSFPRETSSYFAVAASQLAIRSVSARNMNNVAKKMQPDSQFSNVFAFCLTWCSLLVDLKHWYFLFNQVIPIKLPKQTSSLKGGENCGRLLKE